MWSSRRTLLDVDILERRLMWSYEAPEIMGSVLGDIATAFVDTKVRALNSTMAGLFGEKYKASDQ